MNTSKIIPNISFLKEDNNCINCLHYSIMVVLKSYGINTQEVIGGSWGLYYRKEVLMDKIKPLFGTFTNYDTRNHGLWGGFFTPASGYVLKHTKELDTKIAGDELKAKINSGIPMVILADSFYLPWRKQYKFRHQAHWFVIYGYENNDIYALDGWEQEFTGKIPYEDLLIARSHSKQADDSYEPLFPNVLENESIEIRKGDLTSKQNFIAELLETIIKNYWKDESDGITYYGQRAIVEFAADIQALPAHYEEAAVKKIMERYFEVIFSFVSQRNIFIKSIACRLDMQDEIGKSILFKLRGLLKHWLVIRNLFYKASIHDTCSLCSSIAERLKILEEEEKQVIEELVLVLNRQAVGSIR